MKTRILNIIPAVLLGVIAAFLLFSSCSKNELVAPSDKAPETQMRVYKTSIVYPLSGVNGSGMSGTITFEKASRGTKVTIQVTGARKGIMHPACIHNNSVTEGGGVAFTLSAVNGNTGRSITTVTSTNFGIPITYEELISYDGFANVHLSSGQPYTILAQGNIGSNY
jgi:hypothetical protein